MTSRVPTNNETPVWGFAGTLLWAGLITIAFVVTQLVVMGVYIGIIHGNVQADAVEQLIHEVRNDGIVISLSTIATFIVCGLLIIGIVALKKGARLKPYLGLVPVTTITLRNWGVILIVLILLSDGLTILLGKSVIPVFVTNLYLTTRPIWLLWLAFIIAAPLFEELFFRGFLFAGFFRSFLGPTGTIILTSASWSMIHFQYDLYGVLTIFVLGLVLGYARYSSGSVLLTMGMHSFANFVATVEAAINTG